MVPFLARMAEILKPRDAAFLKRWELSRAQGRWKFIFLTGALAWGLPMFVVMTFFANPPAALTVATVLVAAVIWLLGGLLFGALVWYFSEKRYKRLYSFQPPPSA